MKYTLSQAAEATGKNKATIQRAIKKGKISASKNASGSYEIDPAELHRVYDATSKHITQRKKEAGRNTRGEDEEQPDSSRLQRMAELEKELAVAQERKAGLEGQLHHLTETVDDLRRRLDQSESRVTGLLSDQRPKGFWRRLFS